jgi:DNA-binding transcriptional ArsR family regulator
MEMSELHFASAEVAGLTDLSRFLVALGDPIRQQILLLLSRERLNVSLLTDRVHLSRPAVSHQIKVLADAGLLVQERLGRERVYRVDANRFRAFTQQLSAFVDRCCSGGACC